VHKKELVKLVQHLACGVLHILKVASPVLRSILKGSRDKLLDVFLLFWEF